MVEQPCQHRLGDGLTDPIDEVVALPGVEGEVGRREEVLRRWTQAWVETVGELRGNATSLVRTSDADSLVGALRVADVTARVQDDGGIVAETDDLRLVGDVALRAGVPIHELRPLAADLEELFFSLTEGTNRNLGAAGDPAAPAMADAIEGQEGTNG